MGVPIWHAWHSHSTDRWVLIGTDVHAPRHAVLLMLLLFCNKTQHVGCKWGWKDCLLCKTQGSSYYFQGVVDNKAQSCVRLFRARLLSLPNDRCPEIGWVSRFFIKLFISKIDIITSLISSILKTVDCCFVAGEIHQIIWLGFLGSFHHLKTEHIGNLESVMLNSVLIIIVWYRCFVNS